MQSFRTSAIIAAMKAKYLLTTVLLVIAGAATAAPADKVVTNGSPASAAPAASLPADAGKARRHDRRWEAIKPYASYGYDGPRPYFYKPYPYYLPLPFGFGVGFDPAYW